ncbi:hypothetical protein PMAYCL1PPCAC_10141, partial [Pristionchus mayeri]
MQTLIVPLLLLFDIAESFGSRCGCSSSSFSSLCPPGLLCFDKLIEKDCDIICSTGDLRYLSSFVWQTSAFLRCDGGIYRRPNGTAVEAVTQLVCTHAPPCNRCPPISFIDYCEGNYKCENGLTDILRIYYTLQNSCLKFFPILQVKNGKRFLTTKSLTCSTDGVWHNSEGASINATEATCTMKKNCQSCDTPPISKTCERQEDSCAIGVLCNSLEV